MGVQEALQIDLVLMISPQPVTAVTEKEVKWHVGTAQVCPGSAIAWHSDVIPHSEHRCGLLPAPCAAQHSREALQGGASNLCPGLDTRN